MWETFGSHMDVRFLLTSHRNFPWSNHTHLTRTFQLEHVTVFLQLRIHVGLGVFVQEHKDGWAGEWNPKRGPTPLSCNITILKENRFWFERILSSHTAKKRFYFARLQLHNVGRTWTSINASALQYVLIQLNVSNARQPYFKLSILFQDWVSSARHKNQLYEMCWSRLNCWTFWNV